MRLPRKGEKGFTLIELLIVVAILGVLAAVIIPNVGRFIGAGKEEAQKTELANVQTAVIAMMTDNQLSTIPNPVTVATNWMGDDPDTAGLQGFPDVLSNTANAGKVNDPNGDAYDFADITAPDLEGYLLYGHDIDASPGAEVDDGARVSYVASLQTAYWYSVAADGSVTQSLTAPP